jgi:hypothetical protein
MEVAVKSDPSVAVIEKIQNPRVNFLRPQQMVDHRQDIDASERDLQNREIQNKGAVQGRLHNLKKQFQAQAPVEVTDGRVKDALAKREQELREQITTGMLSREEMRKNPVGAVDQHRRWEKANKPKIMEWKKIRLAMQADSSDPDTWDRDAANLEQYRPEGATDRFRSDAQITGKMSYTHVPQDRWDLAFEGKGPENTALAQAERVAESAPAGRRPMSEENRRKAAERLALARAKKQQMKAQGSTLLEG